VDGKLKRKINRETSKQRRNKKDTLKTISIKTPPQVLTVLVSDVPSHLETLTVVLFAACKFHRALW
jgi:hypothetical protein